MAAAAQEQIPGSVLQQRLGALRSRDFRLLWIGSVISNVGTWMHIVSQGWLMYQLTDSPLFLGLIGLARAVPLLSFPLWGGVVADRIARVRILYVTQLAAMVLAAWLATMTVAGLVQPWHILVFSFLSATVLAFDNPARQALVPDLVGRDDIVNAATLNNWAFSGATLVGPALAAAVLPIVGIGGVFYLNAASFGAVVVALALMHNTGPVKPLGSSKQTLMEGLRYVRDAPGILSLILMAAIVSLLGRSYAQLMPVFARDFLGLDVSGMSLLYAAAGGGTLAGLAALVAVHSPRRKGLLTISAGLAFAVALTLFAGSRVVVVAAVWLFVTGLSLIVFSTTVSALLQLIAPAELRGRVMSVYTLAWQGLEYVGVFALGGLAVVWGTQQVVVGAAAIIIAGLLLVTLGRRDVAGID
jgi:MFS family permease